MFLPYTRVAATACRKICRSNRSCQIQIDKSPRNILHFLKSHKSMLLNFSEKLGMFASISRLSCVCFKFLSLNKKYTYQCYHDRANLPLTISSKCILVVCGSSIMGHHESIHQTSRQRH